jgi:hypothetical protein
MVEFCRYNGACHSQMLRSQEPQHGVIGRGFGDSPQDARAKLSVGLSF